MFKMLGKKLKSNKAFTLVELVVVIAILGILAAMILPRILGFQDRARAQADKQSAVQVRNALALLNANGEITLGAGTYTVDAADPWTVTVAGITASKNADGLGVIDADDVIFLVEDLTGAITLQGDDDIILTTAADGSIIVTSP